MPQKFSKTPIPPNGKSKPCIGGICCKTIALTIVSVPMSRRRKKNLNRAFFKLFLCLQSHGRIGNCFQTFQRDFFPRQIANAISILFDLFQCTINLSKKRQFFTRNFEIDVFHKIKGDDTGFNYTESKKKKSAYA